MKTFPCGCKAKTKPASDGGLIILEFLPVCPASKNLFRSISAVRRHFESQR